MQVEKAPVRLRRPRRREKLVLHNELSKLHLQGIVNMDRLYLLDISGGSYMDVFEVPLELYTLLDTLNSSRISPYSLGFYIGLLEKRPARFKPSIPLAFRACRLCGSVIDCHILDSRGALIFTYGKPVAADRILRLSPDLAPVLSVTGECLGWGEPCRRDTIKYLCPRGDIGWYLRRGG